MDKNLALEKISLLGKCKTILEISSLTRDICELVDYGSPIGQSENQQDHISLYKYLQDLQMLNVLGITLETKRLLEELKDTETDLITYLDNFVYDDTEYENIIDYVTTEFVDTKDFCVHLAKTYFKNNLEKYIGNIKQN